MGHTMMYNICSAQRHKTHFDGVGCASKLCVGIKQDLKKGLLLGHIYIYIHCILYPQKTYITHVHYTDELITKQKKQV